MGTFFKARFKTYLITGLLVTLPAMITFIVLSWLFRIVDGIASPVLDKLIGEHIAGLGFITAFCLILFVGILTTTVVGKKLIFFFEAVLAKIPFFKNIYSAVKQLVDAFSPNNKSAFKRVVIAEYPTKGTYIIGFQTGETLLNCNEHEEALISVYIPTNNLYLGDVRFFKKEDIHFPEISIEEGIKIILSGGIAAPKNFNCDLRKDVKL